MHLISCYEYACPVCKLTLIDWHRLSVDPSIILTLVSQSLCQKWDFRAIYVMSFPLRWASHMQEWHTSSVFMLSVSWPLSTPSPFLSFLSDHYNFFLKNVTGLRALLRLYFIQKSINHPFIYWPCQIYSSFHLPTCHIYIHHSYSCNTAFIHSARVSIFQSQLFNATNVFLQEMPTSVRQQKWNVSTEHLVRSAPKNNLLVIIQHFTALDFILSLYMWTELVTEVL